MSSNSSTNSSEKTYPLPYEAQHFAPFIGTKRADEVHEKSIHLIGFGFDGTTSFRPGTRFGPQAIREASLGFETYSPYMRRDLTEVPTIYDLGNLPFLPSRADLNLKNFWNLTDKLPLKEQKIAFVLLGGEHSISIATIKPYLEAYPDLVLIHLDAHADLRESFLEDENSHACIIRNAVNCFGSGHQLIQYGIRSGPREEFDWMEKNKTLHTSLESFLSAIRLIPDDRPIYLTLDLDFFDPAYLPGTGTPEAGGETFDSYIKLMKILSKKNFVGADVVELAPYLDPTGNSSCFAVKVVRELLLSFNL